MHCTLAALLFFFLLQIEAITAGQKEILRAPRRSPMILPYSPAEFLIAQGAGDTPLSIAYNKDHSNDVCIGGGELGSCDKTVDIMRNEKNMVPPFECSQKVCYKNPMKETPAFPPFGL